MKTNIKTALILCLCAVSIITCAAAFRIGTEARPEAQTVAAMSHREQLDSSYLLRESGGYIAVYSSNNTAEPVTVTDIEICTLNDNDRQMLRYGITAENKAELISLLEDLSS